MQMAIPAPAQLSNTGQPCIVLYMVLFISTRVLEAVDFTVASTSSHPPNRKQLTASKTLISTRPYMCQPCHGPLGGGSIGTLYS